MQWIDDNIIDYAKFSARPKEAAFVRPASHWSDQVVSHFWEHSTKHSISLPFTRQAGVFAFRPQEVTIWSGINGHGKSALISACVLYWAANGERVGIASLEMPPVKQLIRMVRQATGERVPLPDLIRKFHAWTDSSIWMYDQNGTVQSKRIIDLGHYLANELHVNHFVVDSLMKCGIPSDGAGWLTAQKTFMDELTVLAKDTNMHVHIVMHPRKGENEKNPVDKMDVRGAGELTDMTDNLLVVWADMEKREQISLNEASYERIQDPDFVLSVKKQRHGEWTGKIPLWSVPDSMQFKNDFYNPEIWVKL